MTARPDRTGSPSAGADALAVTASPIDAVAVSAPPIDDRAGDAASDPGVLEAELELEADLEAIAPPTPRPAARRRRGWVRPLVGFIAIVVVMTVLWEGAKWLAGDRWDIPSVAGLPISIEHDPPFRLKQVNDLNLPHVWTVAAAFFDTDLGGETYLQSLVSAALFTFRGAFVGFALGASVGLLLATLLVHFAVVERALLPILVASQTIPIIALAPVIVVGLKAGWFSIAIVAAYLTFFPVTVAAIRGMRSADPRAFELMRSYASGDRTLLWKLRLPASAPYLFTAFKIAATASVVGAIVGELPSGIRDGLGGSILTAMQYYTIQPGRLWAAIVVAAALGVVAFLLVVIAERWALRGYPPTERATA